MIGQRFLLQLDKGLWATYGKGCAKTLMRQFARQFETESAAQRALARYRKAGKEQYENATLTLV